MSRDGLGLADTEHPPDKPARRGRRAGYDKEDALQIEAASFLSLALPKPGAFFFHVPNGGYALSARTGAKFRRMGLKSGTPDIAVIHTGSAYFLELKARYGTLGDAQKIVIPEIEAAGSPVAVCRTLEEIVDALTAWGIPLRASLETFRNRSTLPQRMSAADFRAAMSSGNLGRRRS